MAKRKASLYPPAVLELIAEKSAVLSKAQAFAEIGMADMATTLWVSAAACEVRLAPLLEAVGHNLEAAVHRISAASCYRRAGDLTGAVNLYRGALSGPLLEHTRREVEQHLAECPNCWVVCDTTRKTIQVFKGMQSCTIPEDVHSRLMAAVERRMAAKKQTSS